MKKIILLSTLAIISTGILVPVAAKTYTECGCDRFLTGGLFKTKFDTEKKNHEDIFKLFLCSADKKLIKQVSHDKTQLGFNVPKFDFEIFNFEKSSESGYIEKWRNSVCVDEEKNMDSESLFSRIKNIGDKDIVSDAEQCYDKCQTGGLFCELVRLDEQTLLFFTNWTNPSNSNKFPKLTGGGVVGGRISDVGAFGERVLQVGKTITKIGAIVPIDATNPAERVSVTIDTDIAGFCEAKVDGVDVSYNLIASLEGFGQATSKVEQKQRHRISNRGSCNEKNVRGSWPICLPQNAKNINYDLRKHSIARGKVWVVLGEPTKYCATLHAQYSDAGRTTLGNCRGNGWVDAELRVFGEVYKDHTLIPQEENEFIILPHGQGTQVTFQYPLKLIRGVKNINWVYQVKVVEKSMKHTVEYELSNAAPNFGNFTSNITNEGTLSVGIISRP